MTTTRELEAHFQTELENLECESCKFFFEKLVRKQEELRKIKCKLEDVTREYKLSTLKGQSQQTFTGDTQWHITTK